MPAQDLGAAVRRDPLASSVPLEIERQLVEQIVRLAVRGQVHAVAEQLSLPVVAQIARQKERAARQRLEDPHVDIIRDAAIKDDARGRVGPRHLVEVALADERIAILSANQVQ